MICIGMTLLLSALTLSYIRFQFTRSAVETEGTVKRLNPPVIEFNTPSGTSVTFTQNFRSKKMPSHIDQKVAVAYLPHDPQNAQLVEYIWWPPALLAVFSIGLFVFGYLTYVGKMVVGPLKKIGVSVG